MLYVITLIFTMLNTLGISERSNKFVASTEVKNKCLKLFKKIVAFHVEMKLFSFMICNNCFCRKMLIALCSAITTFYRKSQKTWELEDDLGTLTDILYEKQINKLVWCLWNFINPPKRSLVYFKGCIFEKRNHHVSCFLGLPVWYA